MSTLLQKELLNRNSFSEASFKQIQKAIDAGKWVQTNGNQFQVRWVSEQAPETECDDRPGCNIVDNLEIKYEEPIIEFTVGRENQIVTELIAPPSSDIRSNLIKYVKDTYGIKEYVPIEILRNEFLNTGVVPE